MNPDPSSLANLRDIVAPSPASWWPLAYGWYLVIGVALVVIVIASLRTWKRWRANAYRREALQVLEGASDPSQIAVILKRAALAAFPRSEVASLTGEGWCDWLEAHGTKPLSSGARESLSRSVFGRGDIDVDAMRRYAITWVKEHHVENLAEGRSA